MNPEDQFMAGLRDAAAGARVEYVIRPAATEEIPDDTLRFRVVVPGGDWTGLSDAAREARMDQYQREWARTRRALRNAVAFVPPEGEGSGGLRYRALWFPRPGSPDSSRGTLERISLGLPAGDEANPVAIATAVERLLASRLRDEIAPDEIKRLVRLGETDAAGVRRNLFPLREAIRWFFCFPGWPAVADEIPLLRAVVQGIGESVFGLVESDGLLPLDLTDPTTAGVVRIGCRVPEGDLAARDRFWLVDPAVLR